MFSAKDVIPNAHQALFIPRKIQEQERKIHVMRTPCSVSPGDYPNKSLWFNSLHPFIGGGRYVIDGCVQMGMP